MGIYWKANLSSEWRRDWVIRPRNLCLLCSLSLWPQEKREGNERNSLTRNKKKIKTCSNNHHTPKIHSVSSSHHQSFVVSPLLISLRRSLHTKVKASFTLTPSVIHLVLNKSLVIIISIVVNTAQESNVAVVQVLPSVFVCISREEGRSSPWISTVPRWRSGRGSSRSASCRSTRRTGQSSE